VREAADGRVNFLTSYGEGAHVVDELSDAQVIRASLAQPEAFKAVFERHFDAIFGYLVRRSGPDAGSDLASEVFVRAFASRARYEPTRADARPWLYGIAANLLHRQRRSETRRLRAYARTGADPLWTVVPELPDPTLAGALVAIKPDDREVLLLFAWADLDYEQIAEALSIPVGTVRSRLNRARRQLRSALLPADQTKELVNG
jgi:DNA-directed RNA polymerase specialized sigma24 family protein